MSGFPMHTLTESTTSVEMSEDEWFRPSPNLPPRPTPSTPRRVPGRKSEHQIDGGSPSPPAPPPPPPPTPTPVASSTPASTAPGNNLKVSYINFSTQIFFGPQEIEFNII